MYERARQSVQLLGSSYDLSEIENPFVALHRTRTTAQFLFGAEVVVFIDEIIKIIASLRSSEEQINSAHLSEADRQQHAESLSKRDFLAYESLQKLDKLVLPYMAFADTGLAGFRWSMRGGKETKTK